MGFRLREVREEKRMTQEELSAKSGISRTTISQIENNEKKTVSSKTLIALADALESTLDSIFFREGV